MERADGKSSMTSARGWYPLRLTSTIRPLVWGGRAIADRLGRSKLPSWNVAESWEVSDVEGAVSFVTNGKYSGASLRDLMRANPADVMGRGPARPVFPLLVKLLDATGAAPLQLEPSGSTDGVAPASVWHVLDAPPGTTALCGTREGVDAAGVHDAIIQQDYGEVLREVPVRPGNTIAIPPGTLYSFGPDTLLYAVTPPSDIHHSPTRWRAEDGSLIGYEEWQREIDSVMKQCDVTARPAVRQGLPLRHDVDASETLLYADDTRAVERWQVAAGHVVEHRVRTAVVLTNVGGPVSLRAGGIEQRLDEARTTLLPSALEALAVEGPADVLAAYVPDVERDVRRPMADAGIRAAKLH